MRTGRPGGNPDLVNYQFKCTIADEKGVIYGVKLPPGMKEALKQKFGKEAPKKVREAIAKLLEE